MMFNRDQTKKTGLGVIPDNLNTLSVQMANNSDLIKLLLDQGKNPYSMQITPESVQKVFSEELIQIIPRVKVDEDNTVRSYLVISVTNFEPTTNPQYMNSILIVDILCHLENWKIESRQGQLELRPYSIGEIVRQMIDNRKFAGIGTATFVGGESMILGSNPDFAGVSLRFSLTDSTN